MNYNSIQEIMDANERFDLKLRETLGGIDEERARILAEGEKWSVADAVEHIAIVEEGIAAICRKLLSKAEKNGAAATGLAFSVEFVEKAMAIDNVKLEAPEMVRPGGGKTLAESLSRLADSKERLNSLAPQFSAYDCNIYKFPHPYIGGMSAAEWLALAGFHKYRHTKQIRRILEKLARH